MKARISNKIYIEEPSIAVEEYARTLEVDNPAYINAMRMGSYKARYIQPKLKLYERHGDTLILPFGTLSHVWKDIRGDYTLDFTPSKPLEMKGSIKLYDYQEKAVEALLHAKGGVLHAPCGSGKTQMGLALISRLGIKALWLTHTHKLLEQSMERCKNYFEGDFGTITEGEVNIGKDITFATVQTLSKVPKEIYENEFNVVVVDECFPYYERVLTENGYKMIRDVKVGDVVASYNEETKEVEYKKVLRTFEKKPTSLSCVRLDNGKEIYCTPNHKFYTNGGCWKQAKELNKNDKVLLQDVWERIRTPNTKRFEKGLRVLLERVPEKNAIRTNGFDEQQICFKKNEGTQPYGEERSKRKGLKNTEKYALATTGKRWKRNRGYKATGNLVRCSCRKTYRSKNRICHSYRNEEKKRIPNLLQSRYRNSFGKTCHRSRWELALCYRKAKTGQEERRSLKWVGVASVTIEEQTSNGTLVGMCGTDIVYNIEVEDNHNYFVEGVLVHNCHRVSGSPTMAKMFYLVVSNCKARYKYGLSATLTRADGLIKTLYATIGDIAYTIDEKEVGSKIIKAKHERVDIDIDFDILDYSDTDGMIDNTKLITMLSECKERTKIIVDNIVANKDKKQLVLCHRVKHCEEIAHELSLRGLKAQVVTGKVKEKNRGYDGNIIVATYALAKEGLDIPTLEVLHLATPQKNESTTKQAVGRIERNVEGKKTPIAYDYVDTAIPYCVSAFVKRRRMLKKCNN